MNIQSLNPSPTPYHHLLRMQIALLNAQTAHQRHEPEAEAFYRQHAEDCRLMAVYRATFSPSTRRG